MNSVKSGSVKILTALASRTHEIYLFITLENIFVSFVFCIILI